MATVRQNSKSKFGLLVGLYGLVCLLLVVAIDVSVRTALDRMQERTLLANTADLPRLERGVADLTAEADRLQAQLQKESGRQIPSADDLEQLAALHGLRLTQMERQQTGRSKLQSGTVRYLTTFRGGATNTVCFLRALEEQYRCAADRVELWPADVSGATVFVQLSLCMREP